MAAYTDYSASLLEGYLMKAKKQDERHWGTGKTKRYFRITHFEGGVERGSGRPASLAFAYYRNASQDSAAAEWLKLKDVKSITSVLPTQFTIVHPKRAYVLHTKTKEECSEWVASLRKCHEIAKAAASVTTPRAAKRKGAYEPQSPACSLHSRDKRKILGVRNGRLGSTRVSVEERPSAEVCCY